MAASVCAAHSSVAVGVGEGLCAVAAALALGDTALAVADGVAMTAG
jgi:hypothetical protein